NGECYKGCTFIYSYEGSMAEQICGSVSKKLENTKQVISLGNSILFIGDKVPLFALSCTPYTFLRLTFGMNGTAKRELDNFEQFETDMKRFSEVLTQVVNACYDQKTPDIKYKIYI
ncbi:MAG: hypothetical protein ACTSQG_11815, partial [Promethearchaeota archaeon]